MIAALRRAAAHTGRLIEAAANARTLARTVRILARQLDNAHLLAASEEARADRAEAALATARANITELARLHREAVALCYATRERVAELEAQQRDWADLSGELAAEQPAADALPDLTDAGEAPIPIEPPPDAYHERDRADALQRALQACEVDLVAARAQLQQTERAAGAHIATIKRLQEQIAAAHRAAHAIAPAEQIPGVAAAPIDVSQPDRCDVCGWPLAASRDEGCVPGDCSYRPEHGSDEHRRITARREAIEAARAAVTEIEPPPPTRPSERTTRTT